MQMVWILVWYRIKIYSWMFNYPDSTYMTHGFHYETEALSLQLDEPLLLPQVKG